jgi:hypothetical protein
VFVGVWFARVTGYLISIHSYFVPRRAGAASFVLSSVWSRGRGHPYPDFARQHAVKLTFTRSSIQVCTAGPAQTVFEFSFTCSRLTETDAALAGSPQHCGAWVVPGVVFAVFAPFFRTWSPPGTSTLTRPPALVLVWCGQSCRRRLV